MESEWFSVRMQAHAPKGTLALADVDEIADALMDLLADHDGVVSADDISWAATISLRAVDPERAAIAGVELIEDMALRAGMPGWPVVRVEAVRQDVLDEENARPSLPELVSGPEAAEILGVSPQRLHQLVDGTAGFPVPVYELRAGKLWLRAAIEAFARRWERKPGRPHKVAAAG